MEKYLDDKKYTPINWNAGNNFNSIIEFIIENIVLAKVNLDWFTSINLLNTLFSISYPKIISYSIKCDRLSKALDKSKKIKLEINNAESLLTKKRNNKELSNSVSKIEFMVYNLMGEFGVLFPFEESTNKSNKLTAYINQR